MKPSLLSPNSILALSRGSGIVKNMASAPNLVLIGEIIQESILVDSHGFKKMISKVDVAVCLISVASIAEVS